MSSCSWRVTATPTSRNPYTASAVRLLLLFLTLRIFPFIAFILPCSCVSMRPRLWIWSSNQVFTEHLYSSENPYDTSALRSLFHAPGRRKRGGGGGGGGVKKGTPYGALLRIRCRDLAAIDDLCCCQRRCNNLLILGFCAAIGWLEKPDQSLVSSRIRNVQWRLTNGYFWNVAKGSRAIRVEDLSAEQRRQLRGGGAIIRSLAW